MKKLFLVLSLAIISAMALGACASGANTATPAASGVVPGTGATGAVTGTVVSGTTAATSAASGTPAATTGVSGTVSATGAASGTPAATGAASGTPAATAAPSGTPSPFGAPGNSSTVFRLSNILGAKVVANGTTVSNPEDIKDNQVLGTVDSVLVDPQSGAIVYVLLKLGEAVPDAPEGLVAVPYKALVIAPRSASSSSASSSATSTSSTPSSTTSTSSTPSGATSTSSTSSGSANFTNDYHDYFTTTLTAQNLQKAPVVDTEKTQFGTSNFDSSWRSYWTGLNIQVPAVGQTGVIHLSGFNNVFPGTDVVAKDGSDVGNIGNFLMDPTGGTLDYVVVNDGALVGASENYTPIPWNKLTYSANPQHFVLDTSAVDLTQAPAFASLNDMETLGTNWEQQVIAFWSNPPTPPAPTSAAATGTVAATSAATATATP